MTGTLEQAVARARELTPERQDSLAALMLTEMESERRWDAQFAAGTDLLGRLAGEALAEFERGETRPWHDARDLARD